MSPIFNYLYKESKIYIMLKKMLEFKGAKEISSNDQKAVSGGYVPYPCSGPNGSNCYRGGKHCPGSCLNGECIPW